MRSTRDTDFKAARIARRLVPATGKRLLRKAAREGEVALLRFLSLLPYDITNTIVISGSPRSGTTWLAGVLNSIPGSSILFEPLHLDRVPGARRAGFSWRTYISPGESWAEGERFMRKVLTGKVLNDWTTREITHPMRTGTWIVKFVRANRMLGWIVDVFPIRKPILLIRHPCAVVASQMSQHWWTEIGPPPEEEFLARHPRFAHVLSSLQTPEEYVAAVWAIDTYVPLLVAPNHGWTVMFYEHLVQNLENELVAAFETWNLAIPTDVSARAAKPSSTTKRSVGSISAWQRRLNREEIRRILDVASAFGIEFYGEDPEPDVRRLGFLRDDRTGTI